ncbi:hypothetical protein [Mesorhizobium captivum]|uniref:hypothetical protein n=1 Tax=Mesorhizobium captivum TaxID=3072319 RepID=UPI002A23EF24|nr:hypothetical protein [Mesorhizobium sp. VK22E]MDX8508744.1 hypothetical protein [Mesorhizobium sp. VK22E]
MSKQPIITRRSRTDQDEIKPRNEEITLNRRNVLLGGTALVAATATIAVASARSCRIQQIPVKLAVGTSDAKSSHAQEDADELAKKLSNPIAAMISVPLQSNFELGAGVDDHGFAYALNVQPVIPTRSATSGT